MKAHKSLTGTLAVLLGLNSLTAWATDQVPQPKEKKEDISSEQKGDNPKSEQKGEPICLGGNDGK